MNDTTDTLPAGDPRAAFATAVATAGALIATVEATDLDRPTPCDDFDVRALLGHLAIVLRRVAALGAGTDPMAMPRVATDIADDAWSTAWTSMAHDVQAAWTDPEVLTREKQLPWVTAPGAAMLATYTAELTVHTWDLGTALGRVPTFDDGVVALAAASSAQALPPGDRVAAFEAMRPHLPPEIAVNGMPFGNPVDVADDAPAIDRLVAWYGRRP